MEHKIFDLIKKEAKRQEENISLIASENYADKEILEATGSILTNKYAEGYPGRRYYGGCEVVDEIELEAINNCKKLFEAEHANVQPHSGSSANFAVYVSQLKPGDIVLGMALSSGGHLTHGHRVNFSGKLYNFVQYGVNPENELMDYDEIESLVNQHKPKMIVAGTSAYPRIVDYERLRKIADDNGAVLFIDMAHVAGLIAAKLHPSPIPIADIVSSTTHKTLRGPRSGFICCKSDFAQKIDRAVMPGCQGGPLMHVIAAKAIAFDRASKSDFVEYQKKVLENAKIMSEEFKSLGYRIVSGGTDTHLFLVDVKYDSDLTGGEVTGAVVEEALNKCNIILNRNSIPFDKESPFITSGIRIGTSAVTTRGFGEEEVKQVANWINEAIKKREDDKFLQHLKQEVIKLCSRFPVYS